MSVAKHLIADTTIDHATIEHRVDCLRTMSIHPKTNHSHPPAAAAAASWKMLNAAIATAILRFAPHAVVLLMASTQYHVVPGSAASFEERKVARPEPQEKQP